MPTVPRYSEQQVRTTGTGAPQLSPISLSSSPESFGAGVGRGLGEVAKVLEQEQDKADTVQALSGDKALADWALKAAHDPEKGALNQRGKNAFGLPDTVQADFDKTAAEIAKGLGNDRQRGAFEKMANTRRESLLKQVAHHVAGEMKSYAKQEVAAYVATAENAAVANYTNPDLVSAEIGRMRNAIFADGKITSEPAELTQLRIAQSQSNIHSAIVRRIMNDKPAEARAYYDEHKDAILEDDKLKLEGPLLHASVKGGSLNLAMSLSGQPLSKQTATVDEMYKTGKISAEIRDATVSRLEHDYSKRKAMQAEGDKNAMGQAQEWILKNPGSSVLDMPTNLYSWAKSSGHLAAMETFAQREGRPGERVKELGARGRLLGMAGSDPATFLDEFKKSGFLSETDLGAAGIKEMQTIASEMLRGTGKYEAKFDSKIMEDAIPKALLGKGMKDQKDAFIGLQHEAMARWRKANIGKQPTIEQQREIAGAANAEYVTSVGMLFDSKLPAWKLKPMPADFREQASAAMQKRGTPVTEAALMKLWARQKGSH